MITLGALNGISGIRHAFFTRHGGVSEGIYASRNCGFGSADDAGKVAENRRRCLAELDAERGTLLTVHQIHSAEAVTVTAAWTPDRAPQADAMVTDQAGVVLGILTADCTPVLLVEPRAGVIGAAHAGWRGALDGILDATVRAMQVLGADPGRIVAGVGPHIARRSYEVGPEFLDRFIAADPDNGFFFAGGPGQTIHFDLGAYVVRRLARLGLTDVGLAPNDTFAEEHRFFSYRRSQRRGEPDYGRCLSAIVIES